MSNFEHLIQQIVHFRDERDWEQFHNSKDLALAISIEAAELNELFLWKNAEEVDKSKLKQELADIFTYCMLLAHKHGLDVEEIVEEKLNINAANYPIDKAKGNASKYNEFGQ
jgi:Predicted pyrophosphatase